MVEIPDDVAKSLAKELRAIEGKPVALSYIRQAADLLDPQPPSLREQVAKAWVLGLLEVEGGAISAEQLRAADAVLAVVADWLAAQPLHPGADGMVCRNQRDNDVSLLRGGSDG